MIINKGFTEEENEVFNKVRALLSLDLIPEKYQDKKIDNLMYGHCYHATLAMYKLLGGKETGYKIKSTFDNEGIKHYWLEIDNRIIDPTIEQYSDLNRELPYSNDKTRSDHRLSKAAKYLIKEIEGRNE
jgi:hypothetical protein